MTKKRTGIIVVVLLAVVIVGIFAVFANRSPKSVEDTPELLEVDELINYNLSASYPATPREVVKLFNRYLLALYGVNGDELSTQQQEALAGKMRDLYDVELLESNPQDLNLQNLAQELELFRKEKKDMIQANVCDSNEVEYMDIGDASGAAVVASYFIKDGSKNFTRTYQKYLLRKDAAGSWKILGFEKVAGGDAEQ